MKTDGDKCEAKVDKLLENSAVQFRIRAINKAGPSEPSSETPMHIVKHRNCKFMPFNIHASILCVYFVEKILKGKRISGEPLNP